MIGFIAICFLRCLFKGDAPAVCSGLMEKRDQQLFMAWEGKTLPDKNLLVKNVASEMNTDCLLEYII